MPAKKGKRGRANGKRTEALSDDEFSNDAASISSSEQKSTDEQLDNDTEDLNQQTIFEDKLREKIDDLTDKTTKVRVDSFIAIEKIFATKWISEFVDDRKLTLADAIERALKKGEGSEICVAARLSTLLGIQLGAYIEIEELYEDIQLVLKVLVNDRSASLSARAECCWALAMNQFLSSDDDLDSLQIITLLSNIFSSSYLKSNGTAPILTPETNAFHASAIGAWALLVTSLKPTNMFKYLTTIKSNYTKTPLEGLCELLHSLNVEIRITVGEALAAIIEIGREYSDNFEDELPYDIADTLNKLSKDGQKYRNKKDRKEQRAEFRDILTYFESDTFPITNVKFNTNEHLNFDTWITRIQYNAFCRLLGPGINIHLAENILLREIFQLGNRIVQTPKSQKTSKHERTLINAAAFKARTIQRGRNRDKRSVAMAQ